MLPELLRRGWSVADVVRSCECTHRLTVADLDETVEALGRAVASNPVLRRWFWPVTKIWFDTEPGSVPDVAPLRDALPNVRNIVTVGDDSTDSHRRLVLALAEQFGRRLRWVTGTGDAALTAAVRNHCPFAHCV